MSDPEGEMYNLIGKGESCLFNGDWTVFIVELGSVSFGGWAGVAPTPCWELTLMWLEAAKANILF